MKKPLTKVAVLKLILDARQILILTMQIKTFEMIQKLLTQQEWVGTLALPKSYKNYSNLLC
jgi:hypothetical protein